MKTFTDTTGRQWPVVVNVNAIKRVIKSQFDYLGEPLKVNLLALVEPESDLLKKVIHYPPLLCDILYALCKPQCDENNVSDEQFGQAMGGDVLDAALDAVLEEVTDFFPQGRRAVFKKLLEKSHVFANKVKTLTAAKLETGELDALIDVELDKILEKLTARPAPTTVTGTAGSLPASSASTPVSEPSEN